MTLLTEKNTAKVEKMVLSAARAQLRRRNLFAFFEHGQWWVEHKFTGAQWSACDGYDAKTNTHFVFEQVTEGEEY